MSEITSFPINTVVFEDLDPITDAQATDADGVLFFDESVGVMKRMTRGELFKGKVIPINSIADFAAIDVDALSDRQQFHLNSFAPTGSAGGGPLLWAPDKPKSLHDGIRYFSPTVPIPSDFDNPTDVQNYMDGVGEEFPTADGIFELTLYSIQSSEFPAVDNALVQFDGVSGNAVKNGPVPSLIGTALIQAPNITEVSYHRLNADETVTARTTAEHKADLSLNNVDNTSDADKPISTATQTALNAKADLSYVNTELDLIDSALALKAPLASPALTGTPTVPTAAENTNTTQAASTAYVQGELTDRVQSVAAIADASALTGLSAGQKLSVSEYNSGTGLGGGILIVIAGSVTPDNVKTFSSATPGHYLERRLEGPLFVEHAGAYSGSNSTAAFQRCLDAGLVAKLTPNAQYDISQRLIYNIDGSGFTCDGYAQIRMLRAGFNQSTYAAVNDFNCGINAVGLDAITLKGVTIFLEPGSGVRTASAVVLTSCTNIDFERTTGYGFQETQYGVFTADSTTGRWVDGHVYDCGTSDDTLATMQITGLRVDEDRVGGVYSQIEFGTWRFNDIEISGAALTKYGLQTDGVTLAGGLTSTDSKGCTFDLIIADNVNEVLDIQSANNSIQAVVASNCVNAVKMVHAARKNYVGFVSADTTYSAAVVFAGSNTASQNCRGNVVDRVVARNIGALSSSLRKTAISFDGSSAILQPSDNIVNSLSAYDNGSADYIVYAEAGTRNKVNDVYFDSEPITARFIRGASIDCEIVFREFTDAVPGYAFARWFGGDMLNSSSTTPLSLSPNVIYASPFVVRKSTTFGQVGFNVTTSGAGLARVGIYKMQGGIPTTLVKDFGTISVSTTGQKEISSQTALPNGIYAIVILTDIACSVYSTTANVQTMNTVGVTNIGNSEHQMSSAFSFAALPATFPSITYTAANIPNLLMRRT